MTEQEGAQLVLLITAHWPYPEVDEFAEAALVRALAAVPAERVLAAVDHLVTVGERYQPRAPAIMAALADLDGAERRARRELEWEERQRARALEPGPTGPPPDVARQLDALRARLSSRGA